MYDFEKIDRFVSRTRLRRVIGGLGLALLVVACQPPADQTTTVDSFVDTVDATPGDGTCADAGGDCSLRAAIMEANATPGIDEILLPAGTYQLSLVGPDEDAGLTGDLDVIGSAYLRASGGTATIDASGMGDRIIDVRQGNFELDGLVLTGGDVVGDGGAVRFAGNLGTLRAQVTGNSASGTGGGVKIESGIVNFASSTIDNNTAASGGGIASMISGLIVENSTISGNTGGGLAVPHGNATLHFSTVAANSGGGISTAGTGKVVLSATVVGDQTTGADCTGTIRSRGYNVDSDATCALTKPTDSVGALVDLGALQDNGGAFQTHEPDVASVLIDRVPDGVNGCNTDPLTFADFTVDQRALVRPVGAGCDVGAVEVQPAPLPAVLINEFVASNDFTLFDEDGDSPDWLELHNPGVDPVDLTGWHLTDDDTNLTKWAVPSITLAPGDHLVIFASSKDRTGPTLHTNFSLSAGGEYFGLTDPAAAVVDEYAPEYPSQTTDLSYGRIAGGGIGFLATPTPGAANSGEALSAVTLSQPSGLFDTDIAVTISEVGNGRTGPIRYTLNGASPDSSSPLYSGPITITESQRLRARIVDVAEAGPETGEVYTRVDPALAATTSDLPLVVVDTLGQTIVDEPEIEAAITIVDRVAGVASIVGPADYSGGVGIDIRGRSSLFFPKKQYKVELHDAAGSDLDADLLGMGAEEDWILYAPGRYDRSMVANPLAQVLAGDVGLHELETQFVEVYLNDGTGPVGVDDYAGLYVLMENIKIGPERVDIPKLSPSDNTEPEVTGGYIFSVDESDDDEFAFRTARGFPDLANPLINLNIRRPKLDDLTTAQQTWFVDHIDEFETALYAPDFADPVTGYRSYIDVDSFIDAHIITLLSKEPDFLRLSNIFTLDREGLIRNEPLWDYDRGFNSDDPNNADPAELFTSDRPIRFGWWGRLFEDPTFVAQYVGRWNELRSTTLSTGNLDAVTDAMSIEIANAYGREDALWGVVAGYGSRYPNGLDGEIDALQVWLADRVAFLDVAIGDFNVSYAYTEGTFTQLPDFDVVAPKRHSVTDDISLDIRDRDVNFAVRYRACVGAASSGTHTFYLTSDEGSRLLVDGALVADNDGLHGPVTVSGTADFVAGEAAFVEVQYFQAAGGFELTVEWEGPGLVRRALVPGDYVGCPPIGP